MPEITEVYVKEEYRKRGFASAMIAYELYCKYAEGKTGIKAIKLPSTSPANASWSFEKLCKVWGEQLIFS